MGSIFSRQSRPHGCDVTKWPAFTCANQLGDAWIVVRALTNLEVGALVTEFDLKLDAITEGSTDALE